MSNSNEQGQFQVDLGGMVELLSRNLYNSSNVYIRELLQNGVDAIHARTLADPHWDDGGTIRLIVDKRELKVIDNGIGLTEDQAKQLLATIGGSSKRDEFGLRRSDYLGQFGIGLLSCFLVSNEITVYTKNGDNAPTVCWRGHANGTWEVSAVADRDDLPRQGTLVVLQAIPGEADFDKQQIAEIARRYGEYLPVTIGVEGVYGGEVLISEPIPVWEDTRRRQVQWCKQHFGFEPFAIIDVSVEIAGFTGVAFVYGHATHPGSSARHRLYLRNILLSSKITDLVPEWAYFVRVVGNTDYLRPTASRDDIVDDELLDDTREQIGKAIRAWMNSLEDDEFRRFLSLHMAGLKALATTDRETRDLVVRAVPMETSHGRLTLGAVMAKGPLRYCATDHQFQAIVPVAAANDLVVVNAGYVYDQEIIEQVRLDHPDHAVVTVTTADIVGAFKKLSPSDESQFLPLIAACQQALEGQDIAVIVRNFNPSSVPVLVVPRDAAGAGVLEKNAREAVGDSGLAGLLDQFEKLQPELDDARAQLVLNAQSTLVYQLLKAQGRPVITNAIRGLYIQALLAGRHSLNIQARTWATEVYSALINISIGE
ncbi:HSP90 family protein [Corynebacterium sp. ES2730-CONJ]|uniref:HSP90 family protein n=1 Tax=Corynebacterium sp. ES2730-CONJ TaxID=2973941 RepID=UPI00216ADB78|nr:HSP90 family protein [Corynebacterium sp. ES2730-CONJ]MCS4531429.1 HSP90 family protein [Corynebacterium sp. ES2730-CONJ]